MNITSAKDLKVPPLNLLVYGDPGVGKTTLIATAPGPVLVLDMEAGKLPLIGTDVDIFTITSLADIRESFKELKNGHKYKTAALDSITEMQKIMMEDIIKTNPNIARSYGDQPSMSDYGRASELMRRTLRAFRDLDMHIIFTALAKDNKDEQDGSIVRIPHLPGEKLPYEIAGYMDVCGYMIAKTNKESGDIERQVIVQPHAKVIAKDRSGKLGNVIEPDISKWVKVINGKGGKK